jgi:APA family basic amino acid/polyamine antiporter
MTFFVKEVETMNEEVRMEKRYGFPTALSMVIGIVIGSGIFFKAVKVLKLTGGSMKNALLVIAIVGCICLICSLFFAKMGREYANCNGLVDYAEAT